MTSTIKVNNIQNQCGANIINESSNTITLGASGDNIVLASGATQAGFGREGSVNWQTGSIKTSTFTATSGEGYFCNTAGGAFTVNLPAGSAGAIVSVSDYTRTFQTNNLTVSPNGSEKIGGVVGSASLSVEGQSATFVYVDGTEGWINIQETSNAVTANTFICASVSGTGNTLTTVDTNFKLAKFTGPGTFTVNSIGNSPSFNAVSYAIVGGGASAAGYYGGGGAGGFRESKTSYDTYTASPLAASGGVAVTAQGYPIAVGAGGAAASDGTVNGNAGNVASGLSITSAGGGFGSGVPCGPAAGSGGSGGGEGYENAGGAGAGNTPPVSPPQGNPGGTGAPAGGGGGGGGGATAVGANSPAANSAGAGGAGATTNIIGSPTAYAGGGGGGGVSAGGAGGTGGGGTGQASNGSGAPAQTGAANTGGGGGARGSSGSGGSGVVLIRYKFQ